MSRMQTLGGMKWQAHRDIDEAAGQARLRHITDVPGQQAVYARKREQAAAYLAAVAADPQADPLPTPGPYIVAEAAALGVTAAELAANVVEIATLWEDTLSPAIEAQRISGKAAVQVAADEAAVLAARDAAIAALIEI
jgi:hypothetical protein